MNNCPYIGNIKMPILGLGTWQLFGTQCVDIVSLALKTGYRHIDTASMYGNQIEIGKALQTSNIDRRDIFLTSKIWPSDLGKKGTRQSLEKALIELKTEYLDLYLIHWPGDDLKKRLESYETMMLERDKGRLKNIGVSNFSISQTLEINREFGEWPVVNQIHVTPFNYDENQSTFFKDKNIIITVYSPLNKGYDLNHPKLKPLSEKYNKSAAQIILRWFIDYGFAAIPKAANTQHLKSNIDIFDFKLSLNESSLLAYPE